MQFCFTISCRWRGVQVKQIWRDLFWFWTENFTSIIHGGEQLNNHVRQFAATHVNSNHDQWGMTPFWFWALIYQCALVHRDIHLEFVSLIVSFRELSEKRISLLGNMVKGSLHGETESMWVFWGGGCFNGKQSSRDGGGRFGFNCNLWSPMFKDCMHNRCSSWCELCQQSHVSIRQAWLCLFDQCSSGMLWMWKKLPYVALLAWGLKSASVLCTLSNMEVDTQMLLLNPFSC